MNQNTVEPKNAENLNNYKTILLIGGFEGDQNLFIKKLLGEKFNNPHPSKVEEYISKECKFNILTKKDLEDLKTDQETQSFRDEICQKAVSYAENDEAKIDAIIIMWRPRPRKNDHSRFLQTIGVLKESFGENVAKSCVFMVQGNWSKMEEKEKAKIKKETQEVEKDFPVEKFDTSDAVEVLEKQLETIISLIEPYKINPPHAQPQVPPEPEEKKEQENETIREIASGNKRIWSTAKYGSILTGSGLVTSLTAIALEQSSVFVAAGIVGITAGSALVTLAAAAGAYKGLSYIIRRDKH